jgi:predicted amidohydrolase YtcJ
MNSASTADAIYFGGDIVTINDAQPNAEAIAVKDGKILFVGSMAEADKFKGEQTQSVDLAGKTLMPNFNAKVHWLIGGGEALVQIQDITAQHDIINAATHFSAQVTGLPQLSLLKLDGDFAILEQMVTNVNWLTLKSRLKIS